MAAPAAKGGLGWAILAAALAIPGFLFFNWWTHLKAERQKSISQKARGRVPTEGVFSTPAPDTGRLVNPVAASTSAPAVAAAPVAASPVMDPGLAVAAEAAPAPTSAPAPTDGSAASVPAGVAPPSAAPDAAVTASSAAAAGLTRDPTLSPMDVVRLQQEEMERRLAEERMRAELANRGKPVKRVEPPIENFVDLQGIIANADGENKAIVNDVVVGVGEEFEARGRSVRVMKITAAGVTFQYKNKRFVKNVNRDE